MITSEHGSATSIDEVIAQLDAVIARSIVEKSRLGFFAALYRNVTLQVKEGIRTGRFEDGPRMERLDVLFANRYLIALEQFRRGESPGVCWQMAFTAAARWRPIILQHLLLGMNAHINYDLGIAAAQCSPGHDPASLKHDFYEINKILAGLVPQVMSNVCGLSPWINLLAHIDPKAEIAVINFSMAKARDSAWELAVRLAALEEAHWAPALAEVEETVCLLGSLVASPIGLIFNYGLWIIRAREIHRAPKVIAVLRNCPAPN